MNGDSFIMEEQAMKLYWISYLIQDKENSKPWLCAVTDGIPNLTKAIEIAEWARQNSRILSTWIDTYDKGGNKTTVYHRCYLNEL